MKLLKELNIDNIKYSYEWSPRLIGNKQNTNWRMVNTVHL